MVEYAIVELLETIGLQRGVDLFLANFADGVSEGVVIKTGSEVSDLNSLDLVTLSIVSIYNDNTVALNTARSIKNKLKDQMGTLGSTCASLTPVTLNGYGTDDLGRQVYAVTAQIAY